MRGTYGLCCMKQVRPLPALLAALLHTVSPQLSSRDTDGGAVLRRAVRGCCADSAESPRENPGACDLLLEIEARRAEGDRTWAA
jgi:hypothetical protein